MTRLLFISVLITVIVSSSSEKLICSSDELLYECPEDCPYDHCPKDRLADRAPCVKREPCQPACKCGFNYRLHENGTCIPTTECPPFKCPANEVFNPCPSYCPSDDCSDAFLNGQCPYLVLFVVNCSPTCRSTDGYFRKNGVCVPFAECPIFQLLKQEPGDRDQQKENSTEIILPQQPEYGPKKHHEK